MAMLSYDGAPFAVRVELEAAHQRVWDRLERAGTWLDGPTRILVAAETRHAAGLCARRKAALSPYTVEGTHDDRGELPGNWIEMIHRIVADPSRGQGSRKISAAQVISGGGTYRGGITFAS
jgi:hypothetical protein